MNGMKQIRVLVGDSVYEGATVVVDAKRIYIEFDSDDLDNITLALDPQRDAEEVFAAIASA